MTYAEKLKDPRWQKKRLEILDRDEWTCQSCGRKDRTLHIHHHSYIYGKDPWDYFDGNFITLCWSCHESEEMYKQSVNDFIHDYLISGGNYKDLFSHIVVLL